MKQCSPSATSFVPLCVLSRPPCVLRNFCDRSGDLIRRVTQSRPITSNLPLSSHDRTSFRKLIVSTTTELLAVKSTDQEAPEIPAKEPMPLFAIKNLPNVLTWLRVVAIPVLVVLFYSDLQHKYLWSAVVFALAGVTDFLDGKIARALNIHSAFGAFLDPVADKLIVATVLVLLSSANIYPAPATTALLPLSPPWLISLPSVIIICREIFISALREWMASSGKRNKVAVGFQGKVKTAVQMISLVLLLYAPFPSHGLIYIMGVINLYLAAILTVTSAIGYIQAAISD